MTLKNYNFIDLIAYDFDGVMTDNTAMLFEDGTEAVSVNRSDGLAMRMIKELGIKQVIITTELGGIARCRSAKLGIDIIDGSGDKVIDLDDYLRLNDIKSDRVMFVGNDINDFEVMKMVGWPVCPSDAHKDIIAISRIVTNASGGRGVIRELLDFLKEEYA